MRPRFEDFPVSGIGGILPPGWFWPLGIFFDLGSFSSASVWVFVFLYVFFCGRPLVWACFPMVFFL